MASVGTCMLFLTIIHISAGSDSALVKVDCESESHGQYGLESILKCVIDPTEGGTDAVIKVVTWKKKGNEKSLVVFRRDLPPTNVPRFRFSEQNLNGKTRDVSLIVNNTQINDRGEYECMVMTDSGLAVTRKINLTVTAKYSAPIVSSIPEKDIPHNTEVTLVCNSEGGYPKGRICWFDQKKNNWTGSSQPDSEQMADKRFHLTSKLTLLKNSVFDHYICSVYNANGGKDGEMTFDLPFTGTRALGSGNPEAGGAVSKIVAPVLVIGSLIVGLLMALLFKKRYSNEARRHSAAQAHLMSDLNTSIDQEEDQLASDRDYTDAELGGNDKLKT